MDIDARLPWGAELPEGLALDAVPAPPILRRLGRDTPLTLALLLGSLQTAGALLAAGARQTFHGQLSYDGSAWHALKRIAAAVSDEEGRRRRMRDAAALLLASGLPAEEAALWEAHSVAAQLAWREQDGDPEDSWLASRLLAAHLQPSGGSGSQQAGEPAAGDGGAGGPPAAPDSQALLQGALRVLGAAINSLDLPAFQAWLRVPALRTLRGTQLLQFLDELSERMLFWEGGGPTIIAEQALLAALERLSGGHLQQALAGQGADSWRCSIFSAHLVANAGGPGRACSIPPGMHPAGMSAARPWHTANAGAAAARQANVALGQGCRTLWCPVAAASWAEPSEGACGKLNWQRGCSPSLPCGTRACSLRWLRPRA